MITVTKATDIKNHFAYFCRGVCSFRCHGLTIIVTAVTFFFLYCSTLCRCQKNELHFRTVKDSYFVRRNRLVRASVKWFIWHTTREIQTTSLNLWKTSCRTSSERLVYPDVPTCVYSYLVVCYTRHRRGDDVRSSAVAFYAANYCPRYCIHTRCIYFFFFIFIDL